MRILLTSNQFVPNYHGGTEILTFNTAKELISRGHEVEVWTTEPNYPDFHGTGRFSSVKNEGVPTHYFNFAKIFNSQTERITAGYNNPFFGEIFSDFTEQYQPDLVHFFHLNFLGIAPIEFCKRQNIPTVLTATDFWFLCPTSILSLPNNQVCEGQAKDGINCIRHFSTLFAENTTQNYAQQAGTKNKLTPFSNFFAFLKRTGTKFFKYLIDLQAKYLPRTFYRIIIWLGRKLKHPPNIMRTLVQVSDRPGILNEAVGKIDKIIAPTNIMKTNFIKAGIQPDRIEKIGYGLKIYSNPTPLQKKPLNELRFAYIGKMLKHKGIHVLIKAFKLLPKDAPAKLLIYGDLNQAASKGYLTPLKEFIDGDPRITFEGTFPNNEINTIFSKIDALVVPSTWMENMPLVILSAQANQTPVIASNVPGISESIRHNVDGVLFEKENHHNLSEILQKCIDDRSFLPRLGSAAKMPKSISAYVDELERLYYGLLGDFSH
ncbi:glycosyltransferase [Bdellovibrionota bacterium]